MRSISMRRTGVLVLAVIFTSWISGSRFSDVYARKRAGSSAQELSAKEILEAEQHLSDLSYWTGPMDGKFDAESRHALIAFQKVERRARTGKLTLLELNALRNASRPVPRHSHYAHVEIDLERQVLFVIGEDGTVSNSKEQL